MHNNILVLEILVGLFLLMVISVALGRLLGKWKIANDPKHKLEVITVAEGAVFALLGLLIAFTFTGSYERFEAREYQIIEEANDIDTAYLRLDLLEPVSRVALKNTFKEYVDARVEIFSIMEESQDSVIQNMKKQIKKLQQKIWNETMAGIAVTNNSASTMLVIPAITNMFEVANTREAIQKIHLPPIVIALLIALSMTGSFFAGYTTARKKIYSSVYILSYILVMTFTLYIIIDLEFPRTGWVRIQGFEQVLQHAKDDIGLDLKNNYSK